MERSLRGAANSTAASQRRVWRGLQNLPRPGRPTRITGEETAGIRKERDGRQYWIVGGGRELISKVTGATYSVSSVYKMLRRCGYFLRAPVKRHVRRPPDEEIARFQKEPAELIPQKIEEGCAVVVQDETIVTADARPRRAYTGKGRRAVCTVTGSHERTVVTACRPWTAGACARSTTGSPQRTLQTF